MVVVFSSTAALVEVVLVLTEIITLSTDGGSWDWCRRSTASSLLQLSWYRTAITEVKKSEIQSQIQQKDSDTKSFSDKTKLFLDLIIHHLKEDSLPVPALGAGPLVGPWQCRVPCDIRHNVCDLIHLAQKIRKQEFAMISTSCMILLT